MARTFVLFLQKRYTAYSMLTSLAYEALLHQAAVGRLLPVPAQSVTQRGKTIYDLNSRKLSAE